MSLPCRLMTTCSSTVPFTSQDITTPVSRFLSTIWGEFTTRSCQTIMPDILQVQFPPW